jgi:hypothetical protein
MLHPQEVLEETCRVANWLKGQGVKKGDSVTLYAPMVGIGSHWCEKEGHADA